MNNTTDFGNNDDLIFFGKVNASISHELKNSMAIISEAAGLLQDLTEMTARGQKVELEMLKSCSQDIIEEIQRGFAIIKQMNTFSHSVDEPVKKVNLINIIDHMVALSKFLSFASKVRFDPTPEEASVVLTCPFRLQNLIYQALVFAFESAGSDGQIVIGLQPQPNGSAHITFSGLGFSNNRSFASDKTVTIAASIGIDIREAADSQSFALVVPESFKSAQQH
ncbi:MAG: HAMP domain-containing histidine kinase [Deltaproteobacteria bacterium]|jgi:signal transduction histidine kinase|nr:HAMP domain-containing histidine kinase [Deltaproteobacteria bacterium]